MYILFDIYIILRRKSILKNIFCPLKSVVLKNIYEAYFTCYNFEIH